jgi:hypothetical protein
MTARSISVAAEVSSTVTELAPAGQVSTGY